MILEPIPRERDPIGLLHSTGYSVTSSRTGSRNRPGTEEHTDEYPGAGRASPRSTRRHRPIREGHGPRRPGPDRPARGGAGDPRAEWRRQDHVRPDNRHPPAANERRVARAGKRCRGRPGERPPGHRPGRSVRRGRAHDDRAREPRNDGPAVRAPEKRGAAGGGNCARAAQPGRLELGAGLVGAPRLLLLAEPTAGLDPTGRREVWDAVRSLAAGGTDVLLTTHYLDEADELADHVVVIDHGRAIASGTLGDIKASVGRDVIEVAVAESSWLDEVGQILERVTSIPPRLDRGSRHASAPSAGGMSELAAVIRCLHDAAIPVDEIGVRRPTLDEVFLTLTGNHANGSVTAGHGQDRSPR